MEKKRLVGVMVFGYWGLLLGVISIIEELLKKSDFNLTKILLGLAFIFLSYSLLKLKNLARIILLVINSIAVFCTTIAAVILLFGGAFKEMYPHFTIAFIHFLIIIYFYIFVFYFTRPKVKEQFKKK